MIDTHCHLDFSQFDRDRDFVLLRIRERLKFVINPTVNLNSAQRTLELLAHEDSFYFLLGFHPHYANDFNKEILKIYDEYFSAYPRIVGIGEIGLDFYKNFSPPERQIPIFRSMLEYAVSKGKLLVIHLRNAEKEMKEILDNYEFEFPVVMHCFSSSEYFFDYALERGFYISFSGNISYPSNEGLRRLIRRVPLERLLLETDSPYLAPLSRRGRRNEPIFILEILEYVALLLQKETDELENIIETNCRRVFFRKRE